MRVPVPTFLYHNSFLCPGPSAPIYRPSGKVHCPTPDITRLNPPSDPERQPCHASYSVPLQSAAAAASIAIKPAATKPVTCAAAAVLALVGELLLWGVGEPVVDPDPPVPVLLPFEPGGVVEPEPEPDGEPMPPEGAGMLVLELLGPVEDGLPGLPLPLPLPDPEPEPDDCEGVGGT